VGKTGFTLIELSIVLVIIGLITGGVLAGSELIYAAQIQKTIADTNKFKTAVMTFKGKYNCLPGDCAKASDFFDSSYDGIVDINGNGDDHIFVESDDIAEGENAFHQLTLTGLFPLTNSNPDSRYEFRAPLHSVGGPFWGILWIHGGSTTTVQEGHYLWMAKSMYPSDDTAFAVITPMDAYRLDIKMDDGLPRSGKVMASGVDYMGEVIEYGPTFDPSETGPAGDLSDVCLTNATPIGYNVQNTSLRDGSRCGMTMRMPF
jgi:prepilin-type N-terminal cleavage/methylation domain-containing protein